MRKIKEWFYRNWTIERVEKKCSKGFYAKFESGKLMGFGRER